MDITEFFQQSAGKWFSQRTSHDLATRKSENGRSEIQIEFLPADHPSVVQLCQQRSRPTTEALCGLQTSWESTVGTGKQRGSLVLVAMINSTDPNQGTLLHSQSNGTGHYVLGSDEALTLTTEADGTTAEERLWFASPNLRLRSGLLKQGDGISIASFISEIRMGVTKPAEG